MVVCPVINSSVDYKVILYRDLDIVCRLLPVQHMIIRMNVASRSVLE